MQVSNEMSNPSDKLFDELTGLFAEKKFAQAIGLAESMLSQFPNCALIWKIKGYALQGKMEYEASLAPLAQALALDPNDAETHNNLAVALCALGSIEKADFHFQQALRIHPQYVKALVNFAMLLQLQERFIEAEAVCKRAIELDPQDASAQVQLGKALEAQGKVSAAQTKYYRADMISSKSQAIGHSNVLYLLSHDVLVEPAELFQEHQAYGDTFEAPLRAGWLKHANTKDAQRCLQVGFVSGDLCHHALANFLEPTFKFLANDKNLNLHAYYTRATEDEVTNRIRRYFPHWLTAAQMNAEALAERIRFDQIDILIDLSGHTARNRLLTFARKPAPVQMSWLGYLGTTGLQAIDYYIADEFWLPREQMQWQFTEKLVYLPSAVTFKSLIHAPDINQLPAQTNSHVTFGSFNRSNKINSSVVVLWSMLLAKVSTSKLLICAVSADEQTRLSHQFTEQGIDPERLEFETRKPSTEYLSLHHRVDVALDTYPHGGGATTAIAAWMGVPTLCLLGETPASRFSAAIMHNLKLDEYICTSIEQFVEAGEKLAKDKTELMYTRQQLRQKFEGSSIGQAEIFTKAFASLLRTVWKQYCSK